MDVLTSRPRNIEVRTFHGWCLNLLRELQGVDAPSAEDEDACEQAVFAAYGRLAADQKATPGELRGHFLTDEIIHVIKHNGLRLREQIREFNRQGRRIPLKQEQRDVVWEVYEEAERRRLAKGRLRLERRTSDGA
jgi:superfamily I DNA/RNA helicase